MTFDKEKINRMRILYPKGTRVELDYMNDPYTKLKSGDQGTVMGVDDACQILMKWDSGSTLSIIPGQDSYRVIQQSQESQEEELEL